ncbi:MAG: phosphatidate cytidylyltransferase [Caldilineaceae bacterium]
MDDYSGRRDLHRRYAGQALALRLLPNGLGGCCWRFSSPGPTTPSPTSWASPSAGTRFASAQPQKELKDHRRLDLCGSHRLHLRLLHSIVAYSLIGALIGLGGGVLALFGDLAISMLKRQVGAKDSGIVMPGHGGMLDRLDSLLSSPLFTRSLAHVDFIQDRRFQRNSNLIIWWTSRADARALPTCRPISGS